MTQTIQLDYSDKTKTPIKNVYFYRKRNPTDGIKIKDYEVLVALCCSSNLTLYLEKKVHKLYIYWYVILLMDKMVFTDLGKSKQVS